ncbi:MAG TPA: PadR family transcriptional regulator [Streptosporangiaceae bacterium]|nr:PadR family transcriptional regulator [Streptosporangiaceae bacterium]
MSPMSGYDLFQTVDRSVSRFWQISKSQVYAELARLEPLGLIQGTEGHQDRVADKRVFTLTAEGEQALDAWLNNCELEEVQFRLPFLLKVLFGHRQRPLDTAALLQTVRREAAEEVQQYADLLDLLRGGSESAYARATVLLGLRMAEALAYWALEAEELPDRAMPVVARREPGSAAAIFRAVPARRPGRG